MTILNTAHAAQAGVPTRQQPSAQMMLEGKGSDERITPHSTKQQP